MSRRRERSRSPVDRRERGRRENVRHERHNKNVSHDKYRDKQNRSTLEGKERRDDDSHHSRQDYDEDRHGSPERRVHRSRGRREGSREFRQEMAHNEGRGSRGPHYRNRDRRRQREEEEPDDTSRYAQSVDAQENNTDAAGAEEPNFGLSGKLTEYTNTYKGVVIKYNEPPEARKPKTRWRLYPFKGEEALKVLYIHRQSAFLLGRQRHIADIPIDHPSCSKQHAVLQYKLADYERTDGTMGRKVKPYIIDLESANGTYLNNERIEPRRYYELKERDVLKFGFSSREYVMLHERSLNTEENQEEPTSSNEDSPE